MNQRWVAAPDGVELALYRLRAYRDGRAAVLLVHGAFSGHVIWLRTRHGDGGLAHYLAGRGLDVWLADLRHHGASRREPRPGAWRFEDWIRQDLPALAARVAEETGGAPLGVVGHSAGGAVAICASVLGTPLTAIATLGTPGPRRALVVRRAGAAVMRWTALALGRFPARALRLGSEDEGARMLGDWLRWNVRGRWTADDGFDYLAAWYRSTTPLLAVAGGRDRLYAPPSACRALANGGARAPRESAVIPELDHVGLLLDPRAREALWPLVAQWLERTLRRP